MNPAKDLLRCRKRIDKNEYIRLIKAIKDNMRLEMIMQTICGTGIRISELNYFTIEAVYRGEITATCKNKTRIIFVPAKHRKMLIKYARKSGIRSGIIFKTRNGNSMNRSNVWREMKRLCVKAGVKISKVFPHNLRKLFAKTFYNLKKDIAKLADILGHSSINTTRIYIMLYLHLQKNIVNTVSKFYHIKIRHLNVFQNKKVIWGAICMDIKFVVLILLSGCIKI